MSRRLFIIGIAVLAVVRLAAAVPLSRPHIRFLQSDGPSYLFLAESLATGRGDTDIFLAEPAPHTRLAPGLPLLLAPFCSGEPNLRVIKFVLNLFALASGLVFLAALRRLEFSRGVTLLAVALFLLAPLGLGQSDDLLPQPPEGLAFAGVLLLLTGKSRALEGAPTVGRAAAAGLLLAACIMLRMADLAFWPGAIIFILLDPAAMKKKLAAAAALSVAPAAALAAWLGRNLSLGNKMGTDYLGVWLGRDPSLEAVAPMGAGTLIARVGQNFLLYVEHAGQLILPDQNPALPTAALTALGTVALALVVLGTRKTEGQAGRALACFGLPLLAECLLWPFPFIHYFYPLYPLLWAAMAAGTVALARMAAGRMGLKAPRWRVVIAAAAAAACLCVSLLPWLNYHPKTAKLRDGLWLRFDAPGAEAVYGLARAAADDCRGSCRLLTHSPMHVALVTGPVVYGLPLLPPNEMLKFIAEHRITHLLVDPIFPRTGAYLVPLIESRPERFEKIDRIMPPPYGAYRVRSAFGR